MDNKGSAEITNISRDARRRGWLRVRLADGRHLRLPQGLAATLHAGQVLSEEQIRALDSRAQIERGFHYALQLVSRRPRSTQEIRQRLRKRKLPPDVQDAILERMAQRGYLDDWAFARAWVEDRMTFRPRGRAMLRFELRQKGIAEEIIEAVLSELDEQQALQLAAAKGARMYRRLDWETFRQRLTGYLARRGFPYPMIAPAVRQAWKAAAASQEESEDETWN